MRIVLTGFMGTGKTVVGRVLAQRLGVAFIDLDEAITARAGEPVRRIFETRGEAAFRKLEGDELRALLSGPDPFVLATGGGSLLDPALAALALESARVFRLSASVETLADRLQTGDRPMLDRPAGVDLATRVSTLTNERESAYRRAGISVGTEGRSREEVADAVLAFLGNGPFVLDHGGSAKYEVIVRAGEIERIGEHIRGAFAKGRGVLGRPVELPRGAMVAVVADRNAWKHHGPKIEAALRRAELRPVVRRIAGGERTKSRAMLARLQDFLIDAGVERTTPVLAIGGGVTGDIGGFASATVLRGLPLVQVPTTLLAQVDASIGGKVAVDHPLGKNLLGAFHPPSLVLADPELLGTLPPREEHCGLAEIVKMALLGSPGLFGRLESCGGGLDDRLLHDAIRESIGIKAEVVRADPRELGLRRILNLGHTFGHAIERCGGFRALSHGEAVAVGLIGALRLGARHGTTPDRLGARVAACISALGLPVGAPGLDAGAIVAALAYDKKRSGGKCAWVLLRDVGDPTIEVGIDDGAVLDAAAAVVAPRGK